MGNYIFYLIARLLTIGTEFSPAKLEEVKVDKFKPLLKAIRKLSLLYILVYTTCFMRIAMTLFNISGQVYGKIIFLLILGCVFLFYLFIERFYTDEKLFPIIIHSLEESSGKAKTDFIKAIVVFFLPIALLFTIIR